MEKKRDLRQSLLAKCIAVLLVFTAGAGAVMGTLAVTLISCGYGVAAEFKDDPMGKDALDGAMTDALYYVVAENSSHSSYYYQTKLERAGGFAARVYEGASAGGPLVGGWGEVPKEYMYRLEKTVELRESEYYTVVGYLTNVYPNGSDFSVRYSLYNTLHGLSFSGVVVLTVLFYVLTLASLVFLCCAAGHKAGRDGISLNWQDRVPLDLYLCVAVGLFCLALLPALAAVGGMPLALEIAACCLSIAGCAVVLLATVLTLATRFKRGKWWRNTIIWRLCRWSVRTWRRCWRAMVEQHHLLAAVPLAGADVAAVLAGRHGAGGHPAHGLAGHPGGDRRAGGAVPAVPLYSDDGRRLFLLPADGGAGRGAGGGGGVADRPAPAGAGHGRGSGRRRPGGPAGHREDVL